MAEDGYFSDSRTIDRLAGRRDKKTKGSKAWNRIQNRINRLSGDDTQHSNDQTEYQASLNSPNQGSNINKGYEPEVAMNKNFGDTSKFDVGNQQDVMKMQRMLVNKGLLAPTYKDRDGNEVNSIDGRFGDDTQGAYRSMMDMSREAKGEDKYTYGNEADPDAANAVGSNSWIMNKLGIDKESIGGGAANGYGINGPPINDGTSGSEDNNNQVKVPSFLGESSATFDKNIDKHIAVGSNSWIKDKGQDLWNATSDWFGENWGGDK